MKICIVTPILFPEPGGPSIFIDRFIGSLRKDGHEVSVIAIGDSDEYWERGKGCHVVKISRNRSLPIRVLKTVFNILKFGRKSDLIFSCGLFLESAISKLLIQIPLVIRIGGDPVWERWTDQEGIKSDLKEFHNTRYSFRIELKKYLQRLSCRMADRVVTPCYFFKKIVEGWGLPPQKVEVIYNGVNEEEISLASKEELRNKYLLRGKKVILTIGRFITLKRIDEIIRSFSEIQGDNLCLLIIGGGPKKGELIDLSRKLDVSERIKFLGVKSHNQVLEYIKAADIFVLNSVDEVMPHVILESLAIGTPVIAPKGGGIPEIIQDRVDGFLYPLKKDNKHELREAIETLLKDGVMKNQLVSNGFIKAAQFDWGKTYSKTLSVLNSILIIGCLRLRERDEHLTNRPGRANR